MQFFLLTTDFLLYATLQRNFQAIHSVTSVLQLVLQQHHVPLRSCDYWNRDKLQKTLPSVTLVKQLVSESENICHNKIARQVARKIARPNSALRLYLAITALAWEFESNFPLLWIREKSFVTIAVIEHVENKRQIVMTVLSFNRFPNYCFGLKETASSRKKNSHSLAIRDSLIVLKEVNWKCLSLPLLSLWRWSVIYDIFLRNEGEWSNIMQSQPAPLPGHATHTLKKKLYISTHLAV